MSSHNKGLPIQGDFCLIHLKYLVSCSDPEIERCLAEIPVYDVNRLRKLLARPVPGDLPEQRKAS
jgi:hypothetical protein